MVTAVRAWLAVRDFDQVPSGVNKSCVKLIKLEWIAEMEETFMACPAIQHAGIMRAKAASKKRVWTTESLRVAKSAIFSYI